MIGDRGGGRHIGCQEVGRGGGGRGAPVLWWQRLYNKVMEDGGGRRVGVFIFSFLGKVESYLESYLANPNTNRV
jgi:hypothetical protein